MKRFLGLSDEEIMENEKLWQKKRPMILKVRGLKSGASVPGEFEVKVKQTLMKPMQMIQKKFTN